MGNSKLLTILTEVDEGHKTPFKAYNEILSLCWIDKSRSEIENRIKGLKNKVEHLYIDYNNSSDVKEKSLISEYRLILEEQISQLKWVIGEL